MNFETRTIMNGKGGNRQSGRRLILTGIAIFSLCSPTIVRAETANPMAIPANPLAAALPDDGVKVTRAPSVETRAAAASVAATIEANMLPAEDDIKASKSGSGHADETAILPTADAKRHIRDGSLMPDDNFPTLFFTAWQHALVKEAKIGYNTPRPPGGKVSSGGTASNTNFVPTKKEPGIREIALGGISYIGVDKWTIWLNGMRVTPNAMPNQILDLKVSGGYIDLKWFDDYTSRIYPIRLRPQERFNLDSRVFLPGAGADKSM